MYYDPRRNEYIVPSTDTLEGFSDDDDVSQLHHHTSEEEEEGNKLNKPETDFTMYDLSLIHI